VETFPLPRPFGGELSCRPDILSACFHGVPFTAQ